MNRVYKTHKFDCKDLAISFHLLLPLEAKSKTSLKRNADGSFACNETDHATLQPLVDFLKQRNACAVITDFSPLRDDRQAVEFVSKRLPVGTPFYQVDAHNVVPAWFASDKVEYAARTIRKKLHDKARHLLTEFPPVIRHPVTAKSEPVDWVSVKESLKELVDERVGEVNWAKGGSLAGFSQLYSFLHHRLHAYATGRNDPTKDALSNLSPWLHFGHISAQRCLWEAKRLRTSHPQSVDAFIEEAFVRRELSDNFCLYNPHYDSIQGAWSWARETLKKHAGDARTPTYSSKAMEKAETGDELWNAAQRQLVQEGKLHGFLRMYWAKKILEWHDGGPEEALQLGFRLNDLYSLDGTDPNGYVGVMWSICGVHDQGWVERPIFGKIRYMNFAGCKRKFDVAAFIRRYPPKREPSSCK
uniref:Deoxyribodipyrimidine photo-lyase n=1 Tax=Mesocestoides corti TaxID=53468 RepID=A0A5K3FQP1_MESCO